jgi:nitric oxide reductase activation protein
MLPLVVLLLVGFALGYGVRELISRRRRKKYGRRVVDRFQPNELDQLGLNLRDGTTRKPRKTRTKAAVSHPEAQPAEKPETLPISQPDAASLEQRIERLHVVMRPSAHPARKVKPRIRIV